MNANQGELTPFPDLKSLPDLALVDLRIPREHGASLLAREDEAPVVVSWEPAFISEASSWHSQLRGGAELICEPVSVYDVENEPPASWPWPDELTFGELSIRIPDPAGKACCGRCRTNFSAMGPTGFSEDQPICDMCLLEGSPELGMVMAVVAVVRAFGSARPLSREEYQEALAELGAFARIYERFASKSGPARTFRIASLE